MIWYCFNFFLCKVGPVSIAYFSLSVFSKYQASHWAALRCSCITELRSSLGISCGVFLYLLELNERDMHYSFIKQNQPRLLIGGEKSLKTKANDSWSPVDRGVYLFPQRFWVFENKNLSTCPYTPGGVHSDYHSPFTFLHRTTCFL